MGHPAVNLDDLSSDEQLDLLEEIWERLIKHPASVPVSEAQRAELGRRIDDLEADIRAGARWANPGSRFGSVSSGVDSHPAESERRITRGPIETGTAAVSMDAGA